MGRRRKKELGKKQVGWFSHYVNAVMNWNGMETGVSPLRGYIAYAWYFTTETFLRWFRKVFPLLGMMDVEGKDIYFWDKSKTYENKRMYYYRPLYLRLESICWSEEGTRIEEEQHMFLSEQSEGTEEDFLWCWERYYVE